LPGGSAASAAHSPVPLAGAGPAQPHRRGVFLHELPAVVVRRMGGTHLVLKRRGTVLSVLADAAPADGQEMGRTNRRGADFRGAAGEDRELVPVVPRFTLL